MNDDVANQQHRLQLLDATAGVCDDDLRFARHANGGQMVVDVDLTQFENPYGQSSRYESKWIGDHQNELFPHGDEQAEDNECGRQTEGRPPSMEKQHTGDGEQGDGDVVG